MGGGGGKYRRLPSLMWWASPNTTKRLTLPLVKVKGKSSCLLWFWFVCVGGGVFFPQVFGLQLRYLLFLDIGLPDFGLELSPLVPESPLICQLQFLGQLIFHNHVDQIFVINYSHTPLLLFLWGTLSKADGINKTGTGILKSFLNS